jgi:predicted GNAT family acetyltransferase
VGLFRREASVPADAPVEVTNDADGSRFEARVGGHPAGHLAYRLEPDRVVLVHTQTERGFEGRGVASALARAALDDARARGLLVIPRCPFVRSYLDRHPEDQDLLPPAA